MKFKLLSLLLTWNTHDAIIQDLWHTNTNHDKQLHTVPMYEDPSRKISPISIYTEQAQEAELKSEWSEKRIECIT